MDIDAIINDVGWFDFGNPPNEKAVKFMMEHFGFPNTDHLSDKECHDLICDLEPVEAWEQIQRTEDENGNPKEKEPLSEYGAMIGGMSQYLYRQFHEGGSRYKPVE